MPEDQENVGGVKAWLSGLLRIGLFPLAFFWPAGDWRWWEGWVVIGLWIGYAVGIGVFLYRHDKDLLRERMKASPAQEGQKRWDKALMMLMTLAGFGIFIVPGFDVVRYGWSEPFPIWVEVTAMALHLPGFLWIGWVMRENTFLARVVKIDEERGHTVITTGPYALVRHPMYTAVIALIFAMPVALGSRWGLLPAGLMAALMVLRTAMEDRTLHNELPGYPEYAKTTRFRLVPGLW
jgi:protein-S-isoprenylcysteine O-methyltransferase Ste14